MILHNHHQLKAYLWISCRKARKSHCLRQPIWVQICSTNKGLSTLQGGWNELLHYHSDPDAFSNLSFTEGERDETLHSVYIPST